MSPTMETKIHEVNERLRQKYIHVDNEWLSGCVEWFIEEDQSIQIGQLYTQAEEQWQLSDLSDSGVACLPDSIFTQKQSHIVNGKFPLQMQYLVDISESAYDQLQKIYGKELDVGKEKPEFHVQATQKNANTNNSKRKRVLKLELTDGHRTVYGMEYTPIACLHTKLPPGTKLLLSGPMRCVNHILFLESKNVKLLGGEVVSLLIENALENVLLRELKQPLNPKPKTDYTENIVNETASLVINQRQLPAIPMPSQRTNATDRPAPATLDDFNDDDLLCDIDIDELAAKATSSTNNSNRNRTPVLFEMDDDDDFLQIDEAILEQPHINTNRIDSSNIIASHSTRAIVNENNANRKSIEISICDTNYAYKIRGINLVTISQLNACTDAQKQRHAYFIIKAEIDAVVEHACVSHERWSLGVLLTDDKSKNCLQVRFASETLEKLTGHTAQEIKEMNLLRQKRPQIAKDISFILKRLTTRLEQLNSFMKVQFSAGTEYPIVIEIIDPAPVLEQKLKEKLEKEN